MSFKIHASNGKVIEINSDIVPCHDDGSGECTVIYEFFNGDLSSDGEYPDDSIQNGIFWFDLIADDGFDFEESNSAQTELNEKFKRYCEWKEVPTSEDGNQYVTECNERYYDHKLHVDNDMDRFKFCPYCGKEIKELL